MDTSLAAYEAVKPHLNKLHHQIIDAIENLGTATLSDVVQHTGVFYDTARRRMSELKQAGLVVNTGDTAENPRGRRETLVRVWHPGSSS